MTSERLIEVAQTLLAATRNSKLRWETTNTSTAFQTVRTKSSAIIESVDGDGSAPYELTILNGEGVVVESVRSELDDLGILSGLNTALAELYEAARRQALSVDDVLDDLLGDLSEGGFGDLGQGGF